jgi:hypothetical protein
MLKKKKKLELMRQIVALREKRRAVNAELESKMIDLYIAMGFTPDQAVKMV